MIFAIPAAAALLWMLEMYARGSANSSAVGLNTGASGTVRVTRVVSSKDLRSACNRTVTAIARSIVLSEHHPHCSKWMHAAAGGGSGAQ